MSLFSLRHRCRPETRTVLLASELGRYPTRKSRRGGEHLGEALRPRAAFGPRLDGEEGRPRAARPAEGSRADAEGTTGRRRRGIGRHFDTPADDVGEDLRPDKAGR